MEFYKDPCRYNKDEDIIFGEWTIVLSIGCAAAAAGLQLYFDIELNEALIAAGLSRDKIPMGTQLFGLCISAFSLFFGILNMFAYAHKLFKSKRKFRNVYKFRNNV